MIKKIDITSESAITYLEEELSKEQMFFDKFLKRMNLKKGKIWTWVPADTSPEVYLNFKHARLFEEKKQGTQNLVPVPTQVKEEVIRLLSLKLSSENTFLIVEDRYIDPQSRFLKEYNLQYLILNDRVYFIVLGAKDVYDMVKSALKKGGPYHYLAVAGRFKDMPRLPDLDDSSDTEKFLSMAANAITCFFVEAYDSEGYLCWTSDATGELIP